jgi:hypothetical protein
LYDDIKHDRCTRCHKKGHFPRTPQKWEQRFDSQKANYWVSIGKWQAKATISTPQTPKPPNAGKGKGNMPGKTGAVDRTGLEKQQYMNVIDCGSDSDDETENEEHKDEYRPQLRTTLLDDDETGTVNTIPTPLH